MPYRNKISTRKIQPQLYVNLDVRHRIDERDFERIREELQKWAVIIFRERFKGGDYRFEITFESGSLKTKITVGIAAVVFLLSQYGNIRQGLDYLVHDLSWAFDTLRPHVEEAVGPQNLVERIRSEKRLGAIARLDQIIRAYQEGKMTDDQYIRESAAILRQIQESPERQLIIGGLVTYIDAVYPNFDWQTLQNALQGLGNRRDDTSSPSPAGSDLPPPVGEEPSSDTEDNNDRHRRGRH